MSKIIIVLSLFLVSLTSINAKAEIDPDRFRVCSGPLVHNIIVESIFNNQISILDIKSALDRCEEYGS
jgi:hypothetical protein